MNGPKNQAVVGVPLVYQREGFVSCIIVLQSDGTVTCGPDVAELHWFWDGETLVLADSKGSPTGRLDKQGDIFAGRIVNDVHVTLYALRWPAGYSFTGEVGRLLTKVRDSPPMRYILGIPFVNRSDLLERAITSVSAMHQRLIVVDNSAFRELRTRNAGSAGIVYEPPIPLTFVQTMNLLQQMADAAYCDVLCVMHNDAEAEAGMDVRFLALLEETWRAKPKFGVLFTHYDALCAFNMVAVRKSGPWDSLFTGYFADVEYYRRMRENGFDEILTDISVAHHSSMTVKSDPRLAQANSIMFPAYERIFNELCK